jgi:crotonobetainyl-CoA:carnitine CoA-transferase CaiB-like acyl-CoA transferase
MKELPLAGIRVIDMSRVLAAPTAAQILGDLGADVIKVERPGEGDESRKYGFQAVADASGNLTGNGSMYIAANRNKRGVTVDISRPSGQALVRRLAAKSDVFIENFKTGDLARYGLDHDAIKAVNPRIVYCSVTGYGHTGPARMKPGYDTIFQARSGWMSINGPSDKEPGVVAANMADTISGYFAAVGVLAALYHRDRADDPAGSGQSIDLALLDATLAAAGVRAQDYLLTGQRPPRRQTLGSLFPCADGQIVVSITSDHSWVRFCGVVGCPELGTDPAYSSYAKRAGKAQELQDKVDTFTRRRTMAELAGALDAVDVPVSMVCGFDHVFADPQIAARGMRKTARHGSGGPMDLLANPLQFSATPIGQYRAPPLLGEHTDEVLQEVLQMDAAAIGELRSQGIV